MAACGQLEKSGKRCRRTGPPVCEATTAVASRTHTREQDDERGEKTSEVAAVRRASWPESRTATLADAVVAGPPQKSMSTVPTQDGGTPQKKKIGRMNNGSKKKKYQAKSPALCLSSILESE